MSNTFFSVTRFVEYVQQNKHTITNGAVLGVKLWFETNESFTNKFNKACIKPIALTINGLHKSVVLGHKKLLEFFNTQPIVSFNENKNRVVNKREDIQYLGINFEKKEFNNIQYYPCEIMTSLDNKLVERIKESKVVNNVNEEEVDESEFI